MLRSSAVLPRPRAPRRTRRSKRRPRPESDGGGWRCRSSRKRPGAIDDAGSDNSGGGNRWRITVFIGGTQPNIIMTNVDDDGGSIKKGATPTMFVRELLHLDDTTIFYRSAFFLHCFSFQHHQPSTAIIHHQSRPRGIVDFDVLLLLKVRKDESSNFMHVHNKKRQHHGRGLFLQRTRPTCLRTNRLDLSPSLFRTFVALYTESILGKVYAPT